VSFPVLEGAGVRLDELVEADAPTLHAYLSLPEVYESTSADPWTLDGVSAFIAACREGFLAGDLVRWAIRRDAGGPALGTCGLFHFDRVNARAELGYDLAPAAWGQGLMTSAPRLVLDFAFERLGLERVEATVLAGNERSLRVLERLGFLPEGTLRGYKRVRGERRDFVMLGLLKGDPRGRARPPT
jgi:RimJ/RimL family protein N-acetyltransferase